MEYTDMDVSMLYFDEQRGIEMSAFRRNRIQKFQSFFTLLLLWISMVTLVFAMTAGSLDELVVFGVKRNVLYMGSRVPLLLIPKVKANVGFIYSCLGYQCYHRSDIDVPDVLPATEEVANAEHLDRYIYYTYATVRSYFNIGYNFGEACASDKSSASVTHMSRVSLAMLVLLVLSLLVISVGGFVLFRQLSNPYSVYHKLNRRDLVCNPTISDSFLNAVVNTILREEKVLRYVLRIFLICGFLSFAFALCSLCGVLLLYFRPGCASGFCSSFTRAVKALGAQNQVSSITTECHYGSSFYITIVFFALTIVLFILILVFCIHIWRDNSKRKVTEAIQYLVELQRSRLEPIISHGVAGGPASPGQDTIMLRLARQMQEDEADKELRGERSSSTYFNELVGRSRPHPSDAPHRSENINPIVESEAEWHGLKTTASSNGMPTQDPEASSLSLGPRRSAFEELLAEETARRKALQKRRKMELVKLAHRMQRGGRSSRKHTGSRCPKGEDGTETTEGGTTSLAQTPQEESATEPLPRQKQRGRRRKKLYDSN